MSDRMAAGERLDVNDSLVSANGRFTLLLQADGDLVLYRDGVAADNAYWSTQTWTLPAAARPVTAVMQADGHFVLYDPAGVPRWASGTWGPAFVNPYVLLQDDGNLVISDDSLIPIWASGEPGEAGSIAPVGDVADVSSLRRAAGAIEAVGFAAEAPSLNKGINQLGRLPPVVSGPSDVGTSTIRSVDAGGVTYTVTEQKRVLVNELVEQAFLQDIASMGVWPGQVIQGRSLLRGDPAPIGPLPRVPGTINVVTDLITNQPHGQSAVVKKPTAGSVNNARRAIIEKIKPTDSPGILKVGIDKASTYREVGVKLGLSVNGQTFDVDANFSLNQTYKQTTAVAVIRQIFYSVTFTPSGPQAGGFWPKTVTFKDISPYVGAGNPPLYIDSVQFGRLICVTMQGAFSSSELIASLRASYEADVGGSVSLDARSKEILESSQVKVYTIGVPGRANFQDLADPISELQQVYQSGLSFNMQNLGAPVSFTARHIADATLARVALGAEYTHPVSAVGADVNDSSFQLWDGPGGGLVDTGINVNPGDNVSVSSDGKIWSGVVFSGTHGPEGWPGYKAGDDYPLPGGTSFALIISFGGAARSWIEAGRFWQGSPPPGGGGRLLLNINDNNPYNGNPRDRWTSRVSVKRANAAAVGVFI